MKLLFLDLLCPPGHKDLNEITIGLLNEINDVTELDLLFSENYLNLKKIKYNNLFFLPKNYFIYKNNFDFRLQNFRKIKWIFKNIKLNEYDIIFISSYETISFSIAWRKQINPRVILFNHNNLEEIRINFVKKLFFKFINKNIEYIVYEFFMRDYLRKIVKNQVWINYQPLDFSKKSYSNKTKKNHKNTFFVYAPSKSNDDILVKKLMHHLCKDKLLEKNIKIYISSKNIEYESEKLVVSNKKLKSDIYKEYFDKSDLILLLFNHYYYRASRVLLDSFVFEKKIVFSNNDSADYYLKEYPAVVDKFNNFEELIEIINKNYLNKNKTKKFDMDYQKIHSKYSNNNIKKSLQWIISNSA